MSEPADHTLCGRTSLTSAFWMNLARPSSAPSVDAGDRQCHVRAVFAPTLWFVNVPKRIPALVCGQLVEWPESPELYKTAQHKMMQ